MLRTSFITVEIQSLHWVVVPVRHGAANFQFIFAGGRPPVRSAAIEAASTDSGRITRKSEGIESFSCLSHPTIGVGRRQLLLRTMFDGGPSFTGSSAQLVAGAVDQSGLSENEADAAPPTGGSGILGAALAGGGQGAHFAGTVLKARIMLESREAIGSESNVSRAANAAAVGSSAIGPTGVTTSTCGSGVCSRGLPPRAWISSIRVRCVKSSFSATSAIFRVCSAETSA